MHRIVHTGWIDTLIGHKVPLSLFLPDSFDPYFPEFLASAWPTLDRITGTRWHIVVPSINSGSNDSFKPSDFNSLLCDELRETYGIERKVGHFLVFDNLNEEEHQACVKLPESFETRRKIIQAAADASQPFDHERDRRVATETVARAAVTTAQIEWAKSKVPVIGSAFARKIISC